ncbi:hypothetical protein AAMO2058_001473800 [Amorphochlora amoebiformis]
MAETLPDRVRCTSRSVLELIRAQSSQPCVEIDHKSIDKEIKENLNTYKKVSNPVGESWTRWEYHFHDPKDPDLTCQYILVLDALNFCFWPLPGYEYEHLAGGLKRAIIRTPEVFRAENLAKITNLQLEKILLETFESKDKPRIPLLKERTRLVREVGEVLARDFKGQASNLVRAAKGSAPELASLVARHFPGFRDHSVYKGRQVFFYKRAQIFVGDVFGAFQGKGLGELCGIEKLTCFADYRVPQLLNSLGIIKYTPSMSKRIHHSREQVLAGSEEEIAIRAATVEAVVAMRTALAKQRVLVTSVQLDWALWERGEREIDSLPFHHRTLTIYY